MPSPPRRRGRGRPRGSVYWHAASERWCAQTPPDRRARRRSRYFATEDAAWAWLDQQLDAISDGADLASGAEKLSTYLRRWLARAEADPDRDWSASTRRTYAWAIDRLADHRTAARTAVADLTRDLIDDLLADLAEELSRKSLTLIRSLLRSTLADLADDGTIARNPVRRARPARHLQTAQTRCPWTEADARTFLATARERSKRPALWYLLLSCGLRSDEARSLKLSDLDLASGTLTVYRSKTRATQTLDLPANVVEALRDHLRRRQAIGGQLFQATPGIKMSGNALLAELRSLRIKAAVPPIGRVHDLRHVAASLMLSNGYPIATVAAVLGHSTPRTTLEVYAHAIPKHVVQAPRSIAGILPWEERPAAKHDRPAVRPAVPAAAPSPRSTLDLTLADRYQTPLEVPPDSEEQIEQIEQCRAESADGGP